MLLALSSVAQAIVVRHDVEEARYRIPASEFAALVDMPHEGHGTLIAPQWVVTAAHTLPMHGALQRVDIGGIAREVEDVVVHPGYRTPPQALIDQAMATGDAVLILVLLASSDDIALIRLRQPVEDVTPIPLYRGSDEVNRLLKIVGKGATGSGDAGTPPGTPHRTALRRAFNTVSSAHERWLCYVFDSPLTALPLEGVSGNGDSGGPALIEVDGEWQLAGMASWKFMEGDVRTARPGRYGQTSCNLRLSHYSAWIEGHIGAQLPAQPSGAGPDAPHR